jgi:hypothetical protein
VTPARSIRRIASRIVLLVGVMLGASSAFHVTAASAEGFCVYVYAQPDTGGYVCTPWD